MKKSNKILITVILLLCAVIGTDCIIGFTIGKKIGAVHILILTAIHLILSYLAIVFIKGSEYKKTTGYKEALIITTIGLVALSAVMYGGFNRLSAGNESVEYETCVEYTDQYRGIMFMQVYFNDMQGNTACVSDKNILWIDEDTYPEDGTPITIREKQGGFGYPVYEIIAVNGKAER